jgi:hypothetical protein
MARSSEAWMSAALSTSVPSRSKTAIFIMPIG